MAECVWYERHNVVRSREAGPSTPRHSRTVVRLIANSPPLIIWDICFLAASWDLCSLHMLGDFFFYFRDTFLIKNSRPRDIESNFLIINLIKPIGQPFAWYELACFRLLPCSSNSPRNRQGFLWLLKGPSIAQHHHSYRTWYLFLGCLQSLLFLTTHLTYGQTAQDEEHMDLVCQSNRRFQVIPLSQIHFFSSL